MVAQRKPKSDNNVVPMTTKSPRNARPASDPEARERQLVSLAVDLAEKQLIDGTASAAVMTHYLKIASKRETLEREILEKQSALIEAKSSAIVKGKDDENIAKEALQAMKEYTSGSNR